MGLQLVYIRERIFRRLQREGRKELDNDRSSGKPNETYTIMTMKETLEEKIRRMEFCRDCIDTSYESGRLENERLEHIIAELKGQRNNNFPNVGHN